MEREIYCEKEFLKSFLSSRPEGDPSVNQELERKLKCWDGIYRALRETIKYFDATPKEISQLWPEDSPASARFERIRRESVFETNDIYPIDEQDFPYLEKNPDLDELDLCAIYFVKDSNTVESLSKSKGLMCFSNESLYSREDYFDIEFKSSQKGSQDFSWGKLSSMVTHNHNSLVIADLYISNNMDSNLIPILDAIVPNKTRLEVPYQVTIFTASKLANDPEGTDRLTNVYNKVRNFLKDYRPFLNRQFCVIECNSKDFHDRGISTNNLFFYDTAGFDLMRNGEATHTSNIVFQYPTFYTKGREYSDLFMTDLNIKMAKDNRIKGDRFTCRLLLTRPKQ